jgi:hypothetical protein
MDSCAFENLSNANLHKGCSYQGGPQFNLSSEPISKLLPVGNQGGIRCFGSIDSPKLIVLYSTFQDVDWPDVIQNDLLIYYGDNKNPGREIHETNGNEILRNIFNNLHLGKKRAIPPVFLFEKGKKGFDRVFRGLLVPGNSKIPETEDLVAIWKTKENQRFQNYKAVFSFLPTSIISRAWIKEIKDGIVNFKSSPEEWNTWRSS